MHSLFEFPEIFKKILSNDRASENAIISSFQAFETCIAHSGMPFFPGYTDHGINHINDTLDISTWIISDDAETLISPKDVMVLMVAILLHDAAMSLTEDSFRQLVKASNTQIKDLDDKSWTELWEEYLGEVSRFDSRKLIRILEENYNLRTYENTHAIYLMCIVRIADYIQIQSQRADHDLLKVRTLRSPLSREEWQLHHSVRDIRFTHPDPEAIDIDAIPKDIKGYFKLSSLLADMQKELDECWAVLGEVYGRYEPLNKLGLRIRRIRSTIEDEKKMSKKIDFLPVKAAFDAAGVDLLKLLIHPLYGDHPGIGIRELIQNAVDACREAFNLIDNDPKVAAIFRQEPSVEVIFSEADRTVTIQDTGVGMTLDTVINYFLKAGATYRKSDAWKKHHSDEKGKSKIIRGGRFGVGVLATYLLGDKFEVTTRHFTDAEDKALHFIANLEDEHVQINNIVANIGTTIKINIDYEDWKKISLPKHRLKNNYIENWSEIDWYCVSIPRVKITYRAIKEYELKPYYSVPNLSEECPPGWYNLKTKQYDAIHWTFYEKAPALTCNGIIVKRIWDYNYRFLWSTGWYSIFSINVPLSSIYDSQGVFPLNLQRTDLSVSQLEFAEKLSEEVAKDFMAFLLVHSPTSCDSGSLKLQINLLKSFKGVTYFDDNNWYPFLIVNRGIAFFDVGVAQKLHINRLICIPSFSIASDDTFADIPEGTALVVFNYSHTYEPDLFRLVRFAFSLGYGPGTTKTLSGSKGRILISKATLKKVQTPGKIAKHFIAQLKQEWEGDDHVVISNNTDSTGLLEFIDLCKTGKNKEVYMPLVEWQINDTVTTGYNISPIGKTISDINKWPLVIPFSTSERKIDFAKVYRTLSTRVSYFKNKVLSASDE